MHAPKRSTGVWCILIAFIGLITLNATWIVFKPLSLVASAQLESGANSAQRAEEDTAIEDHTLFLPFILKSGYRAPSAGVLLTRHPHVTREQEVLESGQVWVRFRLVNSTDRPLDALTLQHHISVSNGVISNLQSVAVAPFAKSVDSIVESGSETAHSCRFSIAGGQVLAVGATVELGCGFLPQDHAVFNTHTTISPEPFDLYDRNYDQISDALAFKLATLNPSNLGAEHIPLLILLDHPPAEHDRVQFESFAGVVTFSALHVPILAGTMPAENIAAYAKAMTGVSMLGEDLTLDSAPLLSDESLNNLRIPNIWQGSLHGGSLTPNLDRTVTGDPETTIAIIDSGVDIRHPALRQKAVGWYDVLGISTGAIDVDGHGSAVAGIIAGNAGEGADAYRGIAFNSSILAVRSGTDKVWTIGNQIAAIDWIISHRRSHNIAAVNSSLGAFTADSGGVNPFWQIAARSAMDAGIVFVAAAGNQSTGAGPTSTIHAPATEPSVLTVGAATRTGLPAAGTARGSAQAANFGIIKPDVLAPGDAVRTIRPGSGDLYNNRSGSSVAAPHVSGQIALMVDAITDAFGADEDVDGLVDEDLWDGIDNDGDGLLDEDPGTWQATSSALGSAAHFLKSIVLMTTFEAVDNSSAPSNDSERGAKDAWEGFGRIAPDAAIEALTKPFCAYGTDIFSTAPNGKKVWARRLQLKRDTKYTLVLDGPADADYDFFLYRFRPDAYGEPLIAHQPGSRQPIQAVTPDSADETLDFEVRASGSYFLIVRRVHGEGQFTIRLVTPMVWTVMVYVPAERAGDSSADGWATAVINDLEQVGSGSGEMRDVQILALVDYEHMGAAPSITDGSATILCIRKDHVASSSRNSVVKIPRSVITGVDTVPVLSGEANMGSAETLSNFVAWSVEHFPAQTYALVLAGDGRERGWKSVPDAAFGLGADTTISAEPVQDALEIHELSSALDTINALLAAGSPHRADTGRTGVLDLLALLSGESGLLEIAHELADQAVLLVATSDRFDGIWPMADALETLGCAPTESGARCAGNAIRLGTELVRTADSSSAATGPEDAILLSPASASTIPALQPCIPLSALVDCVDRLAVELQAALEKPGADRLDAADNPQRNMVRQTQAAGEGSHPIDTIDLLALAAQLRRGAPSSAAQESADDIYLALTSDSGMIRARSATDPESSHAGLAIYYPSRLPPRSSILYAVDGKQTSPGSQPNQGRAAGLRFTEQTAWDELLHRLFKPTAVACIDWSEGCTQTAIGAVGTTFRLRAAGSSDFESEPPAAAYWDYHLGEDSDAALPDYDTDSLDRLDTPCSEDCDRDGLDETDDDADAVGMTVSWTCREPGYFPINLTVHDNNHIETGEPIWHVDSDQIGITCVPAAGLTVDRRPLIGGSEFEINIVLSAYPTATASVTGTVSLPLPEFVTVDLEGPASHSGDGSLALSDGTVLWSGLLQATNPQVLTIRATLDGPGMPLDRPVLDLSADIFDGLTRRTLSASIPLVVKAAANPTVAIGEVTGHTVAFQASSLMTGTVAVSLYEVLPAGTTYTGEASVPVGSSEPEWDEVNRILHWAGTVPAGSDLRINYGVRYDDPLLCGQIITGRAQIHDGVHNFGGLIAPVQVDCP